MGTPFQDRRAWFDEHVPRATCPCCGYPTIEGRGAFEICVLCYWEDDGQDDDDATEPSSPNQGMPLDRARRNFASFMCLYDSEEAKNRREDTPALKAAKEALISAYDGMRSVKDQNGADAQWKLIRDREGAVFNARHAGAG